MGQLGNRLLLAGEFGTVSTSASLSPSGPWSLISQLSGQTSALSKISFADGTYKIMQDDGTLLISSDARVWSRSTHSGLSGFNDQISLGDERLTVADWGKIKRIRPNVSVIAEKRGTSFWQTERSLFISEAPSGRRRLTLALAESPQEPGFYRLRAFRR